MAVGLGEQLSPTAAAAWLQQHSGRPCPVPVGVVGPREARPAQLEIARALGRALAGLGLVVLCGGRQGVMEAVSAGTTEAGGLVEGLLPDEDAGMAQCTTVEAAVEAVAEALLARG